MKRLENCPNCGGLLDDFGSCQFCGSKIYDLCDIDVRCSGRRRSKGKTYIRILTDNEIILAPVITNTINIRCAPDEIISMGDVTIQEINEVGGKT